MNLFGGTSLFVDRHALVRRTTDRRRLLPLAKNISAHVDWVIHCVFELLVDSVRLVFPIDRLDHRQTHVQDE